MKKLIYLLILILNFNFVHCHTPVFYDYNTFGLTAGSSFLVNSNQLGISPELCLTVSLANFAANVQYNQNLKPIYNFYIGVGLVNIIQVQYGFSEHRKIRIHGEIPIGNSMLIRMKKNETFLERLNLKFQYEMNIDDKSLNQVGIGLSYLLN